MVLAKAEALQLDGAPPLQKMVDLVACPTVEVEALALVIGMQSGAVMAASVFLVELPHGIVPLNVPRFVKICNLPSFVKSVGCEVLLDPTAIGDPRQLVHICAASTATYEAKVVTWTEESADLQGPSECLSVPPVNTEADDDLSSPITSIAPLKGQGYFIVSKSAGTRIAVSALPDRLREINLVGFDPAARLQGEVLSPNGTEIVAICCGGTVNKQQSRVMLRRARRVMVDIETALLTGPPTVQAGISSDEQANQLLSVLPSGYSATSLLIFNEQGQMPAASGGMDVDAGPGTAVGAPLESTEELLSKARVLGDDAPFAYTQGYVHGGSLAALP
ncbi:hypothetical protein Pmar_PMAR003221 [Perkinsus marinus ATCC 50983]|uniref:Uncharacterized protein n=1 Tax=Perkinsus marinus (strain ATCC 50983 / TXsc) TaxID=423536 RepID=C5LKI1_PERM5|nr:hypothetical protein Pmar_PMAR003221 [Perkinsus marinus ATCC 50983]EER02748.1 hypothetical protein Pmar_PMAR003221 [Perkinsus marinus ATCC 50983]|eukprot:XP_002770932.1 hypothetical protein Pmar_PMAR003221 [Perkinsus marinus ATCC 50983]